MAQGLGDQDLANLLSCPPEQHVPQLEQFEKFVLGQMMYESEARSHEVVDSISKTHDEILREQAWNEALNRTVESLSARSIQPRPIRMDPPKFDGTAARTIVHWLLDVEQCGVAQLIDDDTRMASYAMSHLRVKRSHHERSLRQRFAPCISRRTTKCCFGRASLARDKRSNPCKPMCRRCARCRRLLVWVRYRNTLKCPRS
uniref:Uncharacterized protein n=1 Tax=Hyaloperonospora arabidopsidis (strain Emoy2) TaxID=559515 RepID=M4BEZ4_HYAAE